MESIRIEGITPGTSEDRWNFSARVALPEGDSLLIRDCLLVRRSNGRYLVHAPSRFRNYSWYPHILWPQWFEDALREAALRALQATGAAL
jgi:hypothetical protein